MSALAGPLHLSVSHHTVALLGPGRRVLRLASGLNDDVGDGTTVVVGEAAGGTVRRAPEGPLPPAELRLALV